MNADHTFEHDLAAYIAGEADEETRRRLEEHARGCARCRAELEAVGGVLEMTSATREELRAAVESVDWEAMAQGITERAFRAESVPRVAARPASAWGRVFGLRLQPVFAGLALGLVVGSLAMYLALRRPSVGRSGSPVFQATPEFLDRVELALARRETLDYLERSQLLLLDFVRDGSAVGRPAFEKAAARDLLSRKRYLNSQLETARMSKAKTICDQIEFLFLELARLDEDLPAAELERLRRIVEERQLLLKINLVKNELESEV
ncbi:MAG: zf-HC2 domain-containing protein [Candidatus Aminicenantes bacterium]|nr:zf-HC2 domain-containing protein [Candidatus Aminicenantes bacterium]